MQLKREPGRRRPIDAPPDAGVGVGQHRVSGCPPATEAWVVPQGREAGNG